MQDDIPIVKQYPPALCIAFDFHCLKLVGPLDFRLYSIGQSVQSPLASPCTDDKVVSERADIPQVENDDILSLGLIKDVQDRIGQIAGFFPA